MLQIGNKAIQNDDYYIRHMYSGLDELIFDISIYDGLYPELVEEAEIIEGSNQTYLIKAIDSGTDTAKIKCQINLDELRANMLLGYTNGSATVYNTIQGVLPSGWTCVDNAHFNFLRTIQLDAATPIEVIEACRDVYSVTFMFDNKSKTVTIVDVNTYQPIGAFATRELNLTEINYKGKSTDFITRLYAYGANNLSFADINNGKPYVDCAAYTSKVICGYWKDDRYTVKENLLAAAQKMVNSSGVPVRSYDCSVVDLAKTNPGMYNFQNFSLFNIVTLIDDSRKTSIQHQVVEYWEYPFMPEKNRVIMSTTPPKIQNSVKNLQEQITSPTSEFAQRQQAAIDAATENILSGTNGYVVFPKDTDGTIKEILIMDTPDIATAQKVWRWNSGGLGYSSTGYNGQYGLAMTQDGAIVADFITVGTLTANLIKAGVFSSLNGLTSINMDSGEAILNGNLTADKVFVKGNEAGATNMFALTAQKSGLVQNLFAPLLQMFDTQGRETLKITQENYGDAYGGVAITLGNSTAEGNTGGLMELNVSGIGRDIAGSISIYGAPDASGLRQPKVFIGVDGTGTGHIILNGREL